MTSLYQTTFFASSRAHSGLPRNVEIDRFYYFDIKKAVAAESRHWDAIVGVPADRTIRANFGKDFELDFSARELRIRAVHVPSEPSIFDSKELVLRLA